MHILHQFQNHKANKRNMNFLSRKSNSHHSHLSMRRGFTLVETMVAILILTIAITVVSSVTQSNLRTSYVSRDQMTAYFLAQEAMEYVRNIRDTDVINNVSWPGGLLLNAGASSQTYCVDPRASSMSQRVVALGSGTCDSIGTLYYNASTGFNHQNSGTASRFSRTVTAAKRGTDEIFFTVSTKWKTSTGVDKEVKIYKSLWTK
jgi:prepilin-type N-terminal cleavage/methylation domain-containing protein